MNYRRYSNRTKNGWLERTKRPHFYVSDRERDGFCLCGTRFYSDDELNAHMGAVLRFEIGVRKRAGHGA